MSSRFHRKVIVKLVPANGPRVGNGAFSYFEERISARARSNLERNGRRTRFAIPTGLRKLRRSSTGELRPVCFESGLVSNERDRGDYRRESPVLRPGERKRLSG